MTCSYCEKRSKYSMSAALYDGDDDAKETGTTEDL